MGDDVRSSDFEVKEFDEVMDFMQEDDDLIAPSTDSLLDSGSQMNELNFEFTESMEKLTLVDSTENEMSREHVCQPFDSLEMEEKNRNRKCNLRKSLAWDSAFFTSAGVLDAEELSSMIGVAEIGGRKVLPGIQEDDMQSSVSTLDSDSLTLESLEAELFSDIRASIQKSNKVGSAMPLNNMSSSQGESHISTPPLEKTDHSSESKAKLALKNTSKKLNISVSESSSKRNKSHPHPEFTKDNHDEKCKEGQFFGTKLPKGPGKPSAVPFSPAKRVSASANNITNVTNVPKRLVGARPAKLPASSKPALPRPTAGGKISVSVSLKDAKKEHSIIRSSTESSSSVTSSGSAKFPVDSLNKNIASKATRPPVSSSKVRIPSRIKSKDCNPPALQTKVQPVHSRLSAYVKSTTTNISNISPASSISDWSNESSSSTSTVNQRSNIQRACAEASPVSVSGAGEGGLPVAFELLEKSSESKIGSDEIAISNLSNKVTNEPKTLSSLPHPVVAKPSGLRMPSPKIGFFDGVKSLARTPKRSVQLNRGMPGGVAKGEVIYSPSAGGSGNAKIVKNQPQTTTGSQKKDNAQPAASVLKRIPHTPGRNSPNILVKNSSAPETISNNACFSSKLEKNASPKTGGKSHFDTNTDDVSTVVLKGNSHGQKNDTRTGVVSADNNSATKLYSSLAKDSGHNMDKVSSTIDLLEIEKLDKMNEATSDTKIGPKDISEANSKCLYSKSPPVIINHMCNDGDQIHELNSSLRN